MKDELIKKLLDALTGIGGRSYMNYQKVPAKLEEFCKQLNQRRSELSNISKEIKEYKKSQENDLIKAVSDPIKSFSDPIKERLYQAVLKDGALNYAEYAAIIGASEATVKRRLGELKKDGFITRVGSNKTGHWEIMNNRHL